jgi:hypothetical protein
MAVTVYDSTTGTNTATLPVGSASGDLIVVFAYRSGSATPPTLPANWTDLIVASVSPSIRVAARKYDGVWTMPTFTNAGRCHAIGIRGWKDTGTLADVEGASASQGPTSTTTVTWAALNTTVDDGSSLVLRGAVSQRPDVVIPVSTSHTGLEGEGTNPGYRTQSIATANPAQATSTVSRGDPWTTAQVEILSAPSGPTGTATVTATGSVTATGQEGAWRAPTVNATGSATGLAAKGALAAVAVSGTGAVDAVVLRDSPGTTSVTGAGSVTATGTATIPSGGYSAEVLADSPIAYYRLAETSGTNAAEETAARDGTYLGGPTLGVTGLLTGDADTAVSFDGVDDQAAIPSTVALTAGSSVTIEYWQNVPAGHANSAFTIGDQTSERCQCHSPYSDGTMYWDYGGGGGSGRVTASYAGLFDQPVHVVLTFDAATNEHAIYLNASLANSIVDATKPTIDLSGGAIGRFSGFYQLGVLDEFAVYDTALSPTRIATHYTAGTSAAGPPAESGTAAVTGAGSASATGAKAASAAAPVSGTSSVTAAAQKTPSAAVTVTGGGTATATASRAARGVVGVTAAGNVTASTVRGARGAVTVAGTGLVTAAGRKTLASSVTVTASGSTVGTGRKAATSTTVVSATGSVTATGVREGGTPGVSGTATVTGTGSTTAAGVRGASSSTSITASGAASATGRHGTARALTITASGSLTASGRRDARASVTLTAGGLLSTNVTRGARGGATVAAGGAVTAVGLFVPLIGGILEAWGAVTATSAGDGINGSEQSSDAVIVTERAGGAVLTEG